ncbi:hypothetical protein M569_04625, partial [Genlisea aurea]
MEGSDGNDVGTSAVWKAEEAVAGNGEALKTLRQFVSYPYLYSREARILGLKWPCGLILYGPPGTGKTSLVRAVVRECDAHLILISQQSVQRSHAGECEKILREAFHDAASRAKSGKPSVIFIDEIDVLCPKWDSRREQENRITAQIGMLMDSTKSMATASGSRVLVVASTNKVDAIDPALRRAGLFDAEIEVSVPDKVERVSILKLYTKKLPLDPTVNIETIAASCNGFVGADLEALCREAADSAFEKSSRLDPDGSRSFVVTNEDWDRARSIVGPSITRGVAVEVPEVSWEDIGGLRDVKKKLQQAVEWPFKHSEAFSRLGVSPVRGILLHGPPGCSKTTLARAAACGSQASFFSLSGADLYSKYVGEGEALLRNTFRKASLAAPSIIFLDEADVVAARRVESSSTSSTVGERLLSTLLTEMDGLEQTKGILVLAATNRPHTIDGALMRPGRFDLVLYVPPPDLDARLDILRVHTRRMKLDSDVDLGRIAAKTELYTGAELAGLCSETATAALREDMSASTVSNRHFEEAMRSRKPALTGEEIETYASFLNN